MLLSVRGTESNSCERKTVIHMAELVAVLFAVHAWLVLPYGSV